MTETQVTLPRTPTRILVFALATLAAPAQTPAPRKPRPTPFPYNPNLILLDPAHGGSDSGAKLSDDAFEKDFTIAFADRLKSLLTARGFTVLLTHEASTDNLSADNRAETANRTRAAACILLHASSAGHGVHLFTSSLAPVTSDPDNPNPVLPWSAAQAPTLPQSTRLAAALSDALYAIRIPLVIAHASVPPLDSVTCPALAIELSPLPGDSPTPATDPTYQDRIANALVAGLTSWRSSLNAQIASQIASQAAAAAAVLTSPTAKPSNPPPIRKPKPLPIPVETPDTVRPPASPSGPPQ